MWAFLILGILLAFHVGLSIDSDHVAGYLIRIVYYTYNIKQAESFSTAMNGLLKSYIFLAEAKGTNNREMQEYLYIFKFSNRKNIRTYKIVCPHSIQFPLSY